MPRQRMIKPDFWNDEVTNGKLTFAARLAYIASWNFADDAGRLRGALPYLQGQIFPFDEGISMTKIYNQLVDCRKWIPYVVNGQRYIFIPNFLNHQTINRPQDSTIPAPPYSVNDSLNESLNQINSVNDSVNDSRPNISSLNLTSLSDMQKGKEHIPAREESFESFWLAYPKVKRQGKGAARKAWEKIKPTPELVEIMLAKLAKQSESTNWRRDEGKWIPMPVTWLNQERWEDEVAQSEQDEKLERAGIGEHFKGRFEI